MDGERPLTETPHLNETLRKESAREAGGGVLQDRKEGMMDLKLKTISKSGVAKAISKALAYRYHISRPAGQIATRRQLESQ